MSATMIASVIAPPPPATKDCLQFSAGKADDLWSSPSPPSSSQHTPPGDECRHHNGMCDCTIPAAGMSQPAAAAAAAAVPDAAGFKRFNVFGSFRSPMSFRRRSKTRKATAISPLCGAAPTTLSTRKTVTGAMDAALLGAGHASLAHRRLSMSAPNLLSTELEIVMTSGHHVTMTSGHHVTKGEAKRRNNSQHFAIFARFFRLPTSSSTSSSSSNSNAKRGKDNKKPDVTSSARMTSPHHHHHHHAVASSRAATTTTTTKKRRRSRRSIASSESSADDPSAARSSSERSRRSKVERKRSGDEPPPKGVRQRSCDISGCDVSSSPPIGCDISPPRLSAFLQDPESLAKFRQFLEAEYSDENLEFWTAVEEYKRSVPDSRGVDAIFSTFLADGAPREVNVSFATKSQTVHRMATPDGSTFNLAQNEIFFLMESDSFKRFLKSARCRCCSCCC